MRSKARVCLVGASGRMGQRCVRLLLAHPSLRLAAMLTHNAAAAPQPAEDVLSTADMAAAVAVSDVVVDFSAPPQCARLLPACVAARVPYVLASTGVGAGELAAVQQAAAHIAMVQAANLSTGVNVMLGLVETAARQLCSFDVEIAEIHHRHKRDAPSGTALALGDAVQRGAGAKTAVLGRSGDGGVRDPLDLGYAALRGGDVAGDHTVFFLGEGERLEITHRSGHADIFAAGALRAASWLLGQPAGRYSMADVIDQA